MVTSVMCRAVLLTLALCSLLQISLPTVSEELRSVDVNEDDNDDDIVIPSEWTPWQIVENYDDDDYEDGRWNSLRQQRRRLRENEKQNGEENASADCLIDEDCRTRRERRWRKEEDARGMDMDIRVDEDEEGLETTRQRQTVRDEKLDLIGRKTGSRGDEDEEIRMSDLTDCRGEECPVEKEMKKRGRRGRNRQFRRRTESQDETEIMGEEPEEYLMHCKCKILDHGLLDDQFVDENRRVREVNRKKISNLRKKSRRKKSRKVKQDSRSDLEDCSRRRECSTNDRKELSSSRNIRKREKKRSRKNLRKEKIKVSTEKERMKEVQKPENTRRKRKMGCTAGQCPDDETAVISITRSGNTECSSRRNCSSTKELRIGKTTELPVIEIREFEDNRLRNRRRRKNVRRWRNKRRKSRRREKRIKSKDDEQRLELSMVDSVNDRPS